MTSERPLLIVFSGLPGTGKTTLSQALARRLRAVHLRVDTIEQALRDLCSMDVQGEGYRLAYRVAADNLRLGMSVVADSCNPVELTRNEWTQVAITSDAGRVNVEVVCSDKVVHRHRVEARTSDVPGLVLPTWEAVVDREYDPWTTGRVVVDTANKTPEESFEEIACSIRSVQGRPDKAV